MASPTGNATPNYTWVLLLLGGCSAILCVMLVNRYGELSRQNDELKRQSDALLRQMRNNNETRARIERLEQRNTTEQAAHSSGFVREDEAVFYFEQPTADL